MCLKYSKTRVKQPLSKSLKIGFQDQLSLNAGQMYTLTVINLPLGIKIFILSILVTVLHRFYCSLMFLIIF